MSESDVDKPSWEPPGRFDIAAQRARQRGADPTGGPPSLDPRVAEELYELCPPGYRNHDVLRAYPILLTRLARDHVDAGLAELRQGYSDLRRELRDEIPVHAIPLVLEMYEAEGRELHRARERVLGLAREIGRMDRNC